jgi:streptomycin 6-kinase
MALALPGNLAAAVERGSVPRDWVAGLPEAVGEAAQRWQLRLGAPYLPGGQCSWVAPAVGPAGQELVLKVAWRHYEADHEADGLRVWAGAGAVRLHDAYAEGRTSVLLLERCRPGTTLAAVPEPEQDTVVAGLLRRLWVAPPAGSPFRPLAAMCAAWAAEFEARHAAAPSVLDPGLVRTGIALFRELPAPAERDVLLCTDLHAGNVLAAEREPWLVVDAKPYVGDPAYDVVQHLLNCPDRLAADPAGLCARLADLVGLDAGRVRRWMFARCVQESLDAPELAPVAAALAPA